MKRLKLGLAALLMVIAAGAFTAVASADSSNSGLPGALNGAGAPAFLPQETNIASLAWRGEELRFVKCSASIPAGGIFETSGVPSSFAPNTINFFVEDFSGDPHYQPHPVVGTFSYTTSHNGIQCVRGDYVSNKAGLASIKLVVTDQWGNKVLEHQFLAGWMAIGPTSVTPTDTTVSEPAGNAVSNLLTVQASGTIPLDEEWQADWGLPASLTMPNDWPLLASKIASTSRALRAANPTVAAYKYWDIHDSSGPAAIGGENGDPDIHVPGYCPPPNNTSTTIDQVDNCLAPFGILGPYSRVFGDSTTAGFNTAPGTIGPFDPQYPEETLLSDGNLNALDAPMPNLRIDVTSNGNTGSFQQIGVGPDLSNIKYCLYSRSHCVGPDFGAPHDFYAPFYAAWIPATFRDGSASDAAGTDGPQPLYTDGATSPGNNFEGYLAGTQSFPGAYVYWQFADVLLNAEGGPTQCLLRTVGGEPVFRQLNTGPQSVAVYTDEHGEAVVEWSPGLNNDLFGGLGPDDNGGCDIEGMDLGGADITAVARYPFQNVAAPVAIPGTLHKAVENLFNKSVSCRLKNNQNPAGTAGEAYICTASAQDIDGSGEVFDGEQVCISREPTGTLYPYPRNGATGTQGELCITLHWDGDPTHPAIGSIETPATLNGTLVDISAFFTDENIIRDTCITVGQPTSTPGPCGAVTIAPPGGTTSGTNTPGTTVVSPVNSTTTLTGAANVTAQTGNAVKSIKASVVSVKVVKTRNGRALVVKVQSPKKTATVRIVLVGKNGRVLVRTVRTIQANKLVRISHLLVPRNVKAVHVNVLR